MSSTSEDVSERRLPKELRNEADKLDVESSRLRFKHQAYTVATIMLGITAPALVTYTPTGDELIWKFVAILATGLATAAATIRTVLRYNERYSNAALTAIALRELEAEMLAKWQDVLITSKDEYRQQKFYEIEAWAQRNRLTIKRGFVEKDVSVIAQEKLILTPLTEVPDQQKSDLTRKT